MHIREHQVVGVFGGTSSNTPSLTSLLNSSSTVCLKCMGICAALWHATGIAFSSMNNFRGGLSDIKGSGCWLHVLNELALYLSLIQASILSRFSMVGGYGHSVGNSGGSVLIGQLHLSLLKLVHGLMLFISTLLIKLSLILDTAESISCPMA